MGEIGSWVRTAVVCGAGVWALSAVVLPWIDQNTGDAAKVAAAGAGAYGAGRGAASRIGSGGGGVGGGGGSGGGSSKDKEDKDKAKTPPATTPPATTSPPSTTAKPGPRVIPKPTPMDTGDIPTGTTLQWAPVFDLGG